MFMYLHRLQGWRPLKQQTVVECGCMVVGHSPQVRVWAAA